MALTYPLTFPLYTGLSNTSFDLSRVEARSRTRGGVIQSAERGRSLWTAELTTVPLATDNFQNLQAFVLALRGGSNQFLLYDPIRQRPVAYPGTGWTGMVRAGTATAFDGTATVTAASGYLVSLSGLPASYAFRAGDMISWPWGTTRTLHRVMESRTATTGGVMTSLQVEPDIPPGQTYPQTARLETPHAHFILAEPYPVFRWSRNRGEPVTIRAIQYLV